MNLFARLFLLAFFMLMSKSGYSTHMAGADLTYEYLGNHQYRITYTFYRDCIGIDAQGFVTLNYFSNTCNIHSSEILYPAPNTGQLISFVCPGAVTTCEGGSDPGIQKWEYTGIVTINQQCPDWSFGVQDCCRNAAITTVYDAQSQDMYVEANLNNTIFENSSPVFSNVPIAFECIGQDNFYNHGGFDAEGDSLVYSFYIPYISPNTPLTYISGYTLADPITSSPSVYIDRYTGDVFMHPTANETGVIAVQIAEYRNGNLVGAVVRDIQIYTANCSNHLPTASGINGTSSFSYSSCAGSQICFDVFTSDADSADKVTALWNQTIPGATFTVDSSGLLPVIHFCWNTTPADIRPQPYFFTITVHDDACPSVGVQSFAYSIFIDSLAASVSTTPSTCNNNDGTAIIDVLGGSGNLSYDWNPQVSDSSSASNLQSGSYEITITNPTTHCSKTITAVVSNSSGLSPVITNITNATCQYSENGVASVSANGGIGPYTYLWEPGGDTTSIKSNLGAGDYIVTINDYLGCSAFINLNVGYDLPAPIINLGNDTSPCFGQSFILDAGAGYSYLWSDNSTTRTISVSQDGTYNVIISDSNGCENSDEITIDFITCMPRRSTFNFPVIAVYPNPATEELNISIVKYDGEITSMKLYNSFSTLEWFNNATYRQGDRIKLDVGSYKPGVYYLELNSVNELKTIRVLIL